jgi:sigma-B regulation protein RsbU (phosphoserine phosphatase)
MSSEQELIEKLTTLNRIAESLNQAVDVRSVLERALADLVELMDLETGWISLREPRDGKDGGDSNYTLAAHHNLPPALDVDNADAWEGSCTCRRLCDTGQLTSAYNEVRCSRLESVRGDRRGLAVHASVPLRSGDRVLGILNVSAPDWASFSPQALNLLTTVGSQMGIALERARLFDVLQERHLHEETALLHFSNQLLSRLDVDGLMDYLVDNVRELLDADACALLLPGGEPGSLEFRAASGWHLDPVALRRQIPINGSDGPGLVMRTLQPVLEEDIQKRNPTAVPAWLQTEDFKGQAVVPLVVEGRAGGILMVHQRQPRLLDEKDLHYLRLMANQAAVAIEKTRLHAEEIKVQAMEKELAIGRQIQLGLLPSAPPVVPGWEFATRYEAAREVGGDFYDFFDLPGDGHRMGMVIADVTGKGVPAALFMARSSTVIRSTGLKARSPSTVLAQVNDLLHKDRPSELLLTASYAVLDTRQGRLVYANGGHCRPLWFQARTGKLRELNSQGVILGAFRGIEFEECAIDLEPGDMLVFYTDGVTEAMDADHQILGEERLRDVIVANAGASAQAVLDAIVDAVQAFAGSIAQSDDLTLFVVRRSTLGV